MEPIFPYRHLNELGGHAGIVQRRRCAQPPTPQGHPPLRQGAGVSLASGEVDTGLAAAKSARQAIQPALRCEATPLYPTIGSVAARM
jgi:hypothetical protein